MIVSNPKLTLHEPSQRKHKNYVLALGGCLLASLTLNVAFNVSIDPYLRFGTKRIPGWNDVKPAALSQIRMAKAYEVQRRPFKTLLLGNSRIDVGLDPLSKSIPASWQPVYNLSQPGTGTDVSLVYLKHACAYHPPSRVVIGIDFMNFLRIPANQSLRLHELTAEISSTGNDLSSARLHDSQWARLKQQSKDAMKAGLSIAAISDSIRTLMAQQNRFAPNMSDHGFNSGDAFRTQIADKGQLALFDQKNHEYGDHCIRTSANFESSKEMDAIRDILGICNASKFRADMFIHPYHVDVLEMLEATDKWSAFEDWKRQVTAVCEQNGVRLWDFSGYNDWTTEYPPPPTDRSTVMSW